MKYYLLLLILFSGLSGYSQVVINEVYPATNQVEIMNIGNDVINMLGGQIFDGMQGNVFFDNSVPTECGDFVLTPGEITVFTFNMNIDNASGQLMLNNTANTPVSFVQWGGVQTLATFAFSSGVWDDPTAFFESINAGNSVQLIDPDNRRDPSGYLQANPSICDENVACAITDVVIRALTCEDNGTTDNPLDDYFTFIPFVEGTNINGNVELTISEGTLTPSSVPQECNNCVVENSIGTANGADYALTITANDGDCIFIEGFTAPESCSPDCSISTHQVLNVSCNDNGTASDPADDYIEFLITVWGFNGSESGYFLVFPDGTEQGPFNYTSSHPISTEGLWAAGMGDFPIIIEDADNNNCNRTITVLDPGSCSDECGFTSVDITNVQCNDNGTDLDPSDDFITFNVEVMGNNLSDEYQISSPDGIVFTPNTGSSLTITPFSTNAGSAGEEEHFYTIILEDATISSCRTEATLVDPGSCSNNCILDINTLDITCNDNGTPEDNSDDFYQLDLMISGTNVNDTYTATIQPFEVDAQILNYNTLYQFTTEPGSADDLIGWGFTFFDTEQQCGGVTLNGMFEGPCSDICNFTAINISSVECNDNGTDDDPSDDFITFDVEVMGNNLSDEYRISSPDEIEITPSIGSPAIITSFTINGDADDAPSYNIVLEDIFTANCGIETTLVNPGTCSESCSLSLEEINISCNNNQTPEDTSDDFYELSLLVNGNNTSDNFSASIPPFAMDVQTLAYGITHTFNTAPGSAASLEEYSITLTDAEQECTGLTLQGMFEYDCILTNTLQPVQADEVKLFPNPVTDRLQIELADHLQANTAIMVRLQNMQAQTVIQQELQGTYLQLDQLPAGSYFITLSGADWISRQIIIKS